MYQLNRMVLYRDMYKDMYFIIIMLKFNVVDQKAKMFDNCNEKVTTL